jgi:ferric-dicitrate binding protein FerR (iron transport regulator)
MNIRFEHIGEMSPEAQAAFLREIGENDAMLTDYAAWLATSERIRSRQEEIVSDRRVLVLAALQRAGMDTALNDDEGGQLRATWPQIEKSWEDTTFLDDILDRIASEATDFEESWTLRERHLRDAVSGVSPRAHERRHARTAWRIAAVAATVIFAGILLFVARRDAGLVMYDVPTGEIQNITMLDGSIVRLFGPAELSYRGVDSKSSRPEVMRLTGDAFFEVVVSDAPFLVETSTARVSVLGTSFGVQSVVDQTDVVVVAGEVSVGSRAGHDSVTRLIAGQTCVVLRDSAPSGPVEVNLSEALAWANLFVFRKTRLSEIAEILSQHYGVAVTVDSGLATKTITGTFDRSSDLEDILETLAKTLGAKVARVSTGYRLTDLS